MLRLANLVGPVIDTPFTRYFTLPVLPTVLGYDPRLQFVHEDDALEVLRRSAVESHAGTYNVSGDGVLMLSQAARRAGRPTLPLPAPTATITGQLFRRAGVVDVSPEQLDVLTYGRAADSTRLRRDVGYVPKYDTADAFDDFVRARGRGQVTTERVRWVERRLTALLTGGRGT
jgi:UDP-glucose 4-epimerase